MTGRRAGDYDFELPADLIAQDHAHPRDASRLLIMRGSELVDACFADLPEFLQSGDALVLNETRVIPARLVGELASHTKIEILLLHPARLPRYDGRASRWRALVKPARRARMNQEIYFGQVGSARVIGVQENGMREIEFSLEVPFARFLEEWGQVPLPPYIRNDSRQARQDYQTVFARVPGSVAAPTAGLHFTAGLLERLSARGVDILKIVLDVGLGTFRPMRTESLDDHVMHAESYAIPAETAVALHRVKSEGRRVIAVGTTVVRALEGCISECGELKAGPGITNLFITPGFRFRMVDALITNFHLPRSTLLVLVSAFAGGARVVRAYRHAVTRRYRFFSFGDAMLIFP
ncbi:MAG: tRNA preQ1(34) S-adenosylmethionine ribosyltransferase-isomerase QueA [Candidatus Meridianibacter frigidus]|nr:MAG: tRNA preQ1(34) S-adenosylmethionine ribosyltransferase-isomerase QueA [Candidatus Eremiobacteraeota bacterium]